MPTRLLSLLFISCTALVGCAVQCSENFAMVREGMSKGEVEELLGRPSSTWVEDQGIERWQWGDNLSSLATSGLFRDADTNRVWVVWFDREGRVQYLSEPSWVERR